MEIIYGKGISNSNAIFELALQHGLLEKSGSWFSYNGERIGQGKVTIQNMIETDKNFADELVAKIKAKLLANPEAGSKTLLPILPKPKNSKPLSMTSSKQQKF